MAQAVASKTSTLQPVLLSCQLSPWHCGRFTDVVESYESQLAQAKLKGLDETGPVAMTTKPYKDVNTFIDNQLTFVSAQGVIPPDQMKCNTLTAQAEEQYKNTGLSADVDCEMPPKEDTPRVWNAWERTYLLSSPTTPGRDDIFPS
ncbi:hypothetical protein LSAT2_004292 [Lamellibrachia satsuma]|nr:hypothetical protein LSAT2_004292 [Lamellibrachia satsuma]